MNIDDLSFQIGRSLEPKLEEVLVNKHNLNFVDSGIVTDAGINLPSCSELYGLHRSDRAFKSIESHYLSLKQPIDCLVFAQATGHDPKWLYVLYDQGGYLYCCLLDPRDENFSSIYYITTDRADESFESLKVTSSFTDFYAQLDTIKANTPDVRNDLTRYTLSISNIENLPSKCISSKILNERSPKLCGLFSLLLIELYPKSFQFDGRKPHYSLRALGVERKILKRVMGILTRWSDSHMKELKKVLELTQKNKNIPPVVLEEFRKQLNKGYKEPFNEIVATHLGI